jgi:hypothetical protein
MTDRNQPRGSKSQCKSIGGKEENKELSLTVNWFIDAVALALAIGNATQTSAG